MFPAGTLPAFDPLDAKDIVSKMRPLTRLILWVFGRRLNRDLFAPVVCRAQERGVLRSHAMHAIAAQFDPTQRGVVGIVARRN